MKRLLPLLVIAALVLSACAKKENTTAPVDTGDNTSSKNSFVVNGNGYSNTSFRAFNDESNASAYTDDEVGSGVVTFSGTIGNNSTHVFSITIVTSSARTGTFTLDEAGVGFTTTDGTLQTKNYGLISGSITITQWDGIGGRCKGTFSGVANEVISQEFVTITNGKFDCRIIEDAD